MLFLMFLMMTSVTKLGHGKKTASRIMIPNLMARQPWLWTSLFLVLSKPMEFQSTRTHLLLEIQSKKLASDSRVHFIRGKE